MGGSSSVALNRYRASSAMDEDEQNALSVAAVKHRDTTHKRSFILEQVDLTTGKNVGTLRSDNVRPDVLDIPLLPRNPFMDYKFVKKIGEGTFCTVYKAINVNDENVKVAIKEVRISEMSRNKHDDFLYELNLMSQLHHSHILRVAAVFEPTHTPHSKVYVAAEYLRGGELMPALYARKTFHEQDIRRFMRELLSAIKYLHKRGVVHGAIVPENVVISEANFHHASVKLVDFGRAECYAMRRHAQEEGVRDDSMFMAPELFSKQQGPAVNWKNLSTAADIWGFGRVMCALLTANFPSQNMYVNVEGPNVFFVDNAWKNVSPECKSMIERILVRDPSRRPTASDLQSDEWFDIPNVFVDEPGQILPNDLTDNLPHLLDFVNNRLLSTSLLVSSGVVNFMKVGRYRNEKKMARLKNCPTAPIFSAKDDDDD